MLNRIPVWQMVLEAAKSVASNVIDISEIRHYILVKYGDVNIGTINCQIIVCCVNRQSRVNYFQNSEPRLANGQYDFLYYIDRGRVALYDSEVHGCWEIAQVGGELKVRPINGTVDFSTTSYVAPIRTATPRSIARRTRRTDIPHPTPEDVTYYLRKWDGLKSSAAQESALNKLFWTFAPQNILLDDVLLKVVTLNTFYSTNIKSVYTVALHIFKLDIDERLKSGDETLVDEIANVTMSNGKIRNEFSFATKYCSHHNAKDYPIYDSYVEKLLRYFRDVDSFANFENHELRVFPVFKQTILKFRNFYSLGAFTVKEIDQYLWQLGKEKFPKNYGKRKSEKMAGSANLPTP